MQNFITVGEREEEEKTKGQCTHFASTNLNNSPTLPTSRAGSAFNIVSFLYKK
jgi:hypothetical protein